MRYPPANDAHTGRREFVKDAMATVTLAPVLISGLLKPGVAKAEGRAVAAFGARSTDAVIRALFPDGQLVPSDAIRLVAPFSAENSAVVPLAVRTSLPDVKSIAFLCTRNPFPLAGTFQFGMELEGQLRTRVKLGESQHIEAIVQAGDTYLTAVLKVEVTSGACGTIAQNTKTGRVGGGTIRVKRDGDKGQLLALIRHPMETGLRVDEETGRTIPAHFIQTIELTINGNRALSGQLGTAISQNPYLGLSIRKISPGDVVKLSWRDNKGITGTLGTTVA